jgi:hypothetical protein
MIVEHPELKFFNGRFEEPMLTVQCTKCRTICKKAGTDIGSATDVARKCGFAAIKVDKNPRAPKAWHCIDCGEDIFKCAKG